MMFGVTCTRCEGAGQVEFSEEAPMVVCSLCGGDGVSFAAVESKGEADFWRTPTWGSRSRVEMLFPVRNRYRHFKGGVYELVGRAVHSDTGKSMAIYIGVKDGQMWARPWGEFFGMVEVEGEERRRFAPEYTPTYYEWDEESR